MNNKLPIWRKETGEVISCVEKIKVMNENMDELAQIVIDAYEDAILMDIDPDQVKKYLVEMINNLNNPYKGH